MCRLSFVNLSALDGFLTDANCHFFFGRVQFFKDSVKGITSPALMAAHLGFKMANIEKLVAQSFRGTEPRR